MDIGVRWRMTLGAACVLTAGAAIGAVLASTAGTGQAAPMPSVVSSADASATVTVDVQGAVAAPGVYQLTADARVIDAIARAGGATDHADTSALNLAQTLVDGTQIRVPVLGEEPVSAAGDGLVNINSADAAALETLPRVGPALAATILAYRDEHGPFETVRDLDNVPGIGPAVLAQLEPLCTV